MRKLIAFNAVLLALTLVATACSQGAPATETASTEAATTPEPTRVDNFKAISRANKAIKEELEKGDPSIEALRTNATIIAGLSPHLPSWFPAGSGPESGTETAALPAIWSQPAEFAARAADLDARAQALLEATNGVDVALMRTRATELAATCKSCHDQFRQKK